MKKNELSFESSSFRDNFGNVFVHQGRILRSVKKVASENYKFLKRENIYENYDQKLSAQDQHIKFHSPLSKYFAHFCFSNKRSL